MAESIVGHFGETRLAQSIFRIRVPVGVNLRLEVIVRLR